MRILSISDLNDGDTFEVFGKDKRMTAQQVRTEYQQLMADNIRESYNTLLEDMKLTEDKNGTVFFKWNKNNTNIQFVKIEIFADKNFQKSILEKIIEADNNSCQIVVPQGLYFWRFSAMGSDGAVIEVPEIFQSGKISVK